MEQTLAERIEQKIQDYTPSQSKVAKYLLDNRDELVFQTAKTIARRIGVSESTVVRFAHAIGFESYRQMQKSVQVNYRPMPTFSERLDTLERGEEKDALDTMAADDLDALYRLLTPEFRAAFARGADLVRRARKIYVVGSRGSASVALHLSYNLNYLRENVILLNSDYGDWVDRLLDCTGQDLVIAISIAQYAARTNRITETAKLRGAKVLAVTDSGLAPICRLSDCALICPIRKETFFWSSAVILTAVNALMLEIAQDRTREQSERLRTLESLQREFDTHDRMRRT